MEPLQVWPSFPCLSGLGCLGNFWMCSGICCCLKVTLSASSESCPGICACSRNQEYGMFLSLSCEQNHGCAIITNDRVILKKIRVSSGIEETQSVSHLTLKNCSHRLPEYGDPAVHFPLSRQRRTVCIHIACMLFLCACIEILRLSCERKRGPSVLTPNVKFVEHFSESKVFTHQFVRCRGFRCAPTPVKEHAGALQFILNHVATPLTTAFKAEQAQALKSGVLSLRRRLWLIGHH